FLCIGFFTSCKKDFLDQMPDDIITLEEVFNRRDLSEEFLANVYNYIRDEAHRTNNTPWDVISDDADVSQRNTPFQVILVTGVPRRTTGTSGRIIIKGFVQPPPSLTTSTAMNRFWKMN